MITSVFLILITMVFLVLFITCMEKGTTDQCISVALMLAVLVAATVYNTSMYDDVNKCLESVSSTTEPEVK